MRSHSGLHLVLGDDEFLSERATKAVIKSSRNQAPASAAVEVSRVSSSEVSAGELMEMLSPSLFAEDRVVVIASAADAGKDARASILAAAQDLPQGMTLIVEHSGGGRAKNLVADLRALSAIEHLANKISRHPDIVSFVRAEFTALGVRAAQPVAEALVEAVGNNLRALASACSQLVSDTGGVVDVAAVRRYHSGVVGISGFTVAEKAVVGNSAGAVEALRWALLTGVPHVVLADALADAVYSIALIGSQRSISSSELAQQGFPPWKVRKVQKQVAHWNAKTIGQALCITARLNGEVKGGAQDQSYALERAVMQVAGLAKITAAN